MSKLQCIDTFYRHRPSLRIGEMIKSEVIPYVRSLSNLTAPMREESLQRARQESAVGFFGHLREAWRVHNELALEIDHFIAKAIDWANLRMWEECLGEAQLLIRRAIPIEDEKRLYTASVKEALDKLSREAIERYRLTIEEANAVLTCWEAPYWVLRDGLHAAWILGERGVQPISLPQATVTRTRILAVLHADSDRLFEERRQELDFAKLQRMESDRLLYLVEYWQSYAEVHRDQQIRIGYLMLERPELKAANELARYDNLIEPLFSSNLWGLPDLLLRKAVVATLVAQGKIDQRPSVLLYAPSELLGTDSDKESETAVKLRR